MQDLDATVGQLYGNYGFRHVQMIEDRFARKSVTFAFSIFRLPNINSQYHIFIDHLSIYLFIFVH